MEYFTPETEAADSDTANRSSRKTMHSLKLNIAIYWILTNSVRSFVLLCYSFGDGDLSDEIEMRPVLLQQRSTAAAAQRVQLLKVSK